VPNVHPGPYETRHKVLLARFTGVFSSDDVAALDRAVIEYCPPGAVYGLLDFTGLEATTVPMSKLLKRAQQPPISPGYKRVFVVSEAQGQEGAREFASQQAAADADRPQIVSTLAEAYRLLGLSEQPHFEPVG
jgi:hypothetical protein